MPNFHIAQRAGTKKKGGSTMTMPVVVKIVGVLAILEGILFLFKPVLMKKIIGVWNLKEAGSRLGSLLIFQEEFGRFLLY